MRHQYGTQVFPFSTLFQQSHQACRSTLTSIFSLPTLAIAWWISSLTLYLRSPSLFPPSHTVYHLWPIPALMLGVWLRVALEGEGWGGLALGLHVFTQTKIFMYVGPRRCVRAPSRVPLLALCVYVSLHGCGIKNTAAWKDACILICALHCASVHVRRSLPADAWSLVVRFSSQMKTLHINYPWPALHGLAPPTEEQELTEHTSVNHPQTCSRHLSDILRVLYVQQRNCQIKGFLNVFGRDSFFTENTRYASN